MCQKKIPDRICLVQGCFVAVRLHGPFALAAHAPALLFHFFTAPAGETFHWMYSPQHGQPTQPWRIFPPASFIWPGPPQQGQGRSSAIAVAPLI